MTDVDPQVAALAPLSTPGPAPQPAGAAPMSGDDGVDRALGRLDELDARPATEHAGVYEEVHQRLVDTLGRSDER